MTSCWPSPPRSKLKDPVVLEQQVKRMLADPRSHQLVVNITGQWLGLRAVPNLTPESAGLP